jgi:intein/homing endonuclease
MTVDWQKLVGFYRQDLEDKDFLLANQTDAKYLSFSEIPEKVDPRQSELWSQNWLQVENQGQIGSCVKGNTLVTMADGSQKMIKHIRYGDYVLSHTRTPRQVIDTMSREYSGDMYKFHVKGWNPIETTADHVMLIQRDGQNKWVRADEVLEDDLMLVSSGVEESTINKIDLTNFVESVDLIEDGDMIRAKGSMYSVNRFLELTEEACYCIGLYCAEGSCDYSAYGTPVRATWTLHQKEDYISSRLKSWATTLGLPFKKSCKAKSKAVNYRISSGVLASFLRNVCGKFCNKKEIPIFILNSSTKQKEAFLQGYLDGDGSYQSKDGTLDKSESRVLTCNQICISTASKKLQLQIAQLSVGLGMKPGLSIKKAQSHQNYENHMVYFYGDDAKKLYKTEQEVANRSLINAPWGQWRKIRSITKTPVKFLDVYDLTVEKDHSFVIGGIVAHNCQGQAITENLEYCYTVATGKVLQFSRMYAYLVSQMYDNIRGDRGSTLSGGTKTVREKGCCVESIAPYPSSYPGHSWVTSAMHENASKYKMLSHTNMSSTDQIKQFIGSGIGIVQIGIAWNNSMTPDSKGCIRTFSSGGGGGHSVTFTGYLPDDEVGATSSKGWWLLLKNSWGTRWGKGGFAYVDPAACDSMLRHQWTVMIGRSEMDVPEPRPLPVDFTKPSDSMYA